MRPLSIIICLAACILAGAQNLTRRLPARSRTAAAPAAATAPDTLRGAACDSIEVSGFDKPLRAMRESMFVTNSSSASLTGVGLEITYTDSRGRMLHKATHSVGCEIPPGETRRVEVRSFDRAGLFHYRLSPVPRGATQATPFDVHVAVTYIITATKQQNQ